MASPQPIPGLEFQPERWDPISARDEENRQTLEAIHGLAEREREKERLWAEYQKRKPPEMRADTAGERALRGFLGVGREAAGTAALSGAGLSREVANALMLARKVVPQTRGAVAGLETQLRTEAEQIERGVRENTRGSEASGPQKAAQVLGGLPLGLAEAAIAVETLGVIPGLTLPAALGAADRGPGAAFNAATGQLPIALAFKGLGAVPRVLRAPAIGGLAYGLSPEKDEVKRLADAGVLAGTMLIPHAAPAEARVDVNGLPSGVPPPGTPPPPAAPAAEVSPLVSRARANLGLPEQPGAHAAPVRIEGRSEPLASQYELVEADSVQASHNAVTFEPNPKYGAQQERVYNRDKNEQAKVIQGADRFNPQEVLNDAPNAVTGPPIVDAQGNAWAGNGRKMMMDRVYAGKAKTAPDVLKSAVVDAAPKFGLDPARAAEMQKPIIVRRLAQSEVPTTREQGLNLSRQLNVDVTNASSAPARAQAQAAALDRGLSAFSDAVRSVADDAPTVRKALESGPTGRAFAEALQQDGIIPPTERADWLTEDGYLNKRGLDQAEELLLARVVPDRALVEAMPAETRAKILRSVPAIMQVESLAPGTLNPLIVDVVRSEIARANVPGPRPSVDEFTGQQLLGTAEAAPSQRDPRVAALQKLIAEGKPTEVSKQLGFLRQRVEAISAGQPDMFTGKVPTLESAFEEVLGKPAQGLSDSSELTDRSITGTNGERIGTIVVKPLTMNGRPSLRVVNSGIDVPGEIGRGHAVRAYETLASDSLSQGRELISDSEVSESAAHVYDALRSSGYRVERHAEAVLEDGRWSVPGKRNTSVFRVLESPARPSQPPEPGGASGAPPEPPRPPPPAGGEPPSPPTPPPEPGRAPPPPPRRRVPRSAAEFYERLAEKRGAELVRARGLATEAAKDAEAPFKQAAGTPLDRPASLRQEEVRALLEELLARKRSTPEAVVDELLSRNDFDTLEHADVLLPSIARFYAAHAEVARRGVVKDELLRELAEQQGLTEKQFLRRMVGETPNAETLLAMKDIVQRRLDRVNDLLDELADPAKASPQKELELATEHKILGLLWAQFRGATAEVGRALRATQLVANRQRARGGRLTLEDLKDVYETSHGGADNVKLLIEKLQTLRHTPELMRTYLRKTYTATGWDQFMYAYRAVLLSGLRTLARNFLGNFVLMIQAPVEKEVGAVAGRMLDLLPARRIRIPIPGTGKNLVNIVVRERAEGVDRARLGEGFADAIGIISSGRAAARLYWDTVFGPGPEGAGVVRSALSLPGRFLFNEEISAEALATQRTSTPIPGRIGTALGVVYRQLEAWDVAFRHANRVGELTALGWRDAGKRGLRKPAEILEHMREFTLDPPEWAWKTADKYAKELTLVAPLGAKGRAWSNFVNKVPPLQFLQPFTRVPTNMWTEIGKRGPIAMMMGDVRTALERGGAERDRAVGQILVGSALLTYAAVLARQGFLNGAGPADPKLRRIKMETGWRPYHVKIGGTYYGIRGAEPLSTQLGVVADLVEAQEHLSSDEAGSIASQFGISIVRNMADQSMMAGLAGVLEAVSLQDPQSLDRFFTRSAAGLLVPRGFEGPISLMKAAGGALSGEPDERPWRADPYLRETRGLMDDVLVRAGMSEAYLKELGRDRLPPRTGFWGQALEKPNVVGPDWVSPFTSSKVNDDPVTAELYRLVLARKNGLPGLPAYDNVPDHIGELQLTPRQVWEYKKGRRNAKLELDKIIAGDRWAALDKIQDPGVRDTIKAQIFDAVITGYQEVARIEMLGNLNDADRVKATMNDTLTRLLRAQGRAP